MNGKHLISKLGLAFALCIWCVGVFAKEYTVQEVPNVRSMNRMEHVCDPDGLLSSEATERINQLLVGLEDSLGVEVAVVALEGIEEKSPKRFANELFRAWGIGSKEMDDGLLIQLIVSPTLRDVCFEMGYGLERVLPDAIGNQIQEQTMLPLLEQGDVSGAVVAGVDAVCQRLYTEGSRPVSERVSEAIFDIVWRVLFLLAVPVVFLALIVWCYRSFRKRAKGNCCPKCQQKFFRFKGTRCLQEATDTSKGLAISVWVCAKCGYTVEERFAIDKAGTRSSENSSRYSYIGRTPYDPYYYRDYEIHRIGLRIMITQSLARWVAHGVVAVQVAVVPKRTFQMTVKQIERANIVL